MGYYSFGHEDDLPEGRAGDDEIIKGRGDVDLLTSRSSGWSDIRGGDGDDLILLGNRGTVWAGDGADRIWKESNESTNLYGQKDNDQIVITGDMGFADEAFGGAGDDIFCTQGANDKLYGDADTGAPGIDELYIDAGSLANLSSGSTSTPGDHCGHDPTWTATPEWAGANCAYDRSAPPFECTQANEL